MTPERLMAAVEAYRMSGGSKEHHARKDALMAEFERLCDPMTEVADRHAHRMALELECVLSHCKCTPRYYNTALNVLGEYRTAMNEIHERQSPTHMGEFVLEKSK